MPSYMKAKGDHAWGLLPATAADYSAARARLTRASQARAAHNFGTAIADRDSTRRTPPQTVAISDPLGPELGLEYSGRPDGSIGTRYWA